MAVACHDAAAPARFPPPARQIVFSAEATPGNREIFVVDADGPGPIRLTHRPGADYAPRWTADGRHIRFWSTEGPDLAVAPATLYEMNVDGSGLRPLPAAVPGEPSPDGQRIASLRPVIVDGYPMLGGSHPMGLFVGAGDGSDATRVAYFGSPNCASFGTGAGGQQQADAVCRNVMDPDWSPDGAWIAFAVRVNGVFLAGESAPRVRQSRLHVVRPDGTDLRLLTGDSAFDQTPIWSPDGQRLAVGSMLPPSAAPCPKVSLQCFWPHLMGADGSGRTLLTAAATADFGLSWAPDGRRLAFGGFAAGTSAVDQALYVVNADGGGLRGFPMPAASPGEPAWNPTMP